MRALADTQPSRALSCGFRCLALAAACAASGLSAAAPAGAAAAARDAAARIDLLRMDSAMMVYDETTGEYGVRARRALDELAPLLEGIARDVSAADAEAGASINEQWQLLRDSLLGGGEFAQGMLEAGYDASQHGYFGAAAQELDQRLAKLQAADTVMTEEERAWVLATDTIAGYVQSAASPFGSYTGSFNSGEDSDPAIQVQRVDDALQALLKKYHADTARADKVRDIQVKWRFIRPAILLSGKKAMPNIVYRHGNAVIAALAALR